MEWIVPQQEITRIMCAQAPLHRQLKNPGLWAPALFPARPLGLTTSKTSQGPALWSKTPHLGSPTAPASAPHPLLPFKSMRMTSKRPKLITDFKSPKFNLPDHCSFKKKKHTTDKPLLLSLVPLRTAASVMDWRACEFRSTKKGLQVDCG